MNFDIVDTMIVVALWVIIEQGLQASAQSEEAENYYSDGDSEIDYIYNVIQY
jgi:hypothetical protein